VNKLTIGNYFSFLETSDNIKEILWKKLRFPTRDLYFNPLVASKQWDGYVEFFKKKTGRFLTGLLPEILEAIKHFEIEVEIEDKRQKADFYIKKIDANFLGNGINLFDYQVDFVNQIIKYQRGIIPAPTGAGKSLMFVSLAKALKEKTPALFMTNSIDLIEQTYEELVKFGVSNVGRFYGKVKKPDWITCCTVQSAESLGPVLGKIKALFVDEVHAMTTKQAKWVYARLPNTYCRVGMSATAFKFGGKDLVQKHEVKGYFGPLLETEHSVEGTITISELQKRKILSKAACYFVEIAEPQLNYLLYQDAITQGIAQNDFLNKKILEITQRIKGRTLILVERVAQGDLLAEMLGSKVAWVSGKDNTKTRKKVIEQLKYSEECIALATRHIFNTGVSFHVHNLINAAGGNAEHMIIQRMGRGLRVSDDKEILLYLDFFFKNNDYLEKHSKKRVSIFRKEGHNVVITKDLDFLKDFYA
jgi:superfamily II DNA or RNA helicase